MDIVIISVLLCVPGLLFAISCIHLMNNNKNEDGYNFYNSSLGIQCNSKEKCDWRHTTMCDTCKHNCGMKEHKNSYIAR